MCQMRQVVDGANGEGWVRALEESVIRTLNAFGVDARREQGAVGIWVGEAKVCAIGVRIKRGISLHGLALNVTTDLDYFNLIVPCGLAGRPVTSLANVLDGNLPPVGQVKDELVRQLSEAFPPLPSPPGRGQGEGT